MFKLNPYETPKKFLRDAAQLNAQRVSWWIFIAQPLLGVFVGILLASGMSFWIQSNEPKKAEFDLFFIFGACGFCFGILSAIVLRYVGNNCLTLPQGFVFLIICCASLLFVRSPNYSEAAQLFSFTGSVTVIISVGLFRLFWGNKGGQNKGVH